MLLQLYLDLISSLERVELDFLQLPSKFGIVFSQPLNQATRAPSEIPAAAFTPELGNSEKAT
jgi:hypothetical protein